MSEVEQNVEPEQPSEINDIISEAYSIVQDEMRILVKASLVTLMKQYRSISTKARRLQKEQEDNMELRSKILIAFHEGDIEKVKDLLPIGGSYPPQLGVPLPHGGISND